MTHSGQTQPTKREALQKLIYPVLFRSYSSYILAFRRELQKRLQVSKLYAISSTIAVCNNVLIKRIGALNVSGNEFCYHARFQFKKLRYFC